MGLIINGGHLCGTALAARLPNIGTRAALERFDWRAIAALRSKNRKKWDAVKQLARYQEVIGREADILTDALQDGEAFLNPMDPAE